MKNTPQQLELPFPEPVEKLFRLKPYYAMFESTTTHHWSMPSRKMTTVEASKWCEELGLRCELYDTDEYGEYDRSDLVAVVGPSGTIKAL